MSLVFLRKAHFVLLLLWVLLGKTASLDAVCLQRVMNGCIGRLVQKALIWRCLGVLYDNYY